jgi:hypothetical protein
MVGPLIGKLILNLFDYYALFQLAAATMTVAMCPLYFCATTAGLVFERLKRFEQGQSKYSGNH